MTEPTDAALGNSMPSATPSVARFTAITFLTLVLDRALGLVLTVIASATFGTDRSMDAYLLAIAGPLLISALASEMLWSTLLPILSAPVGAKRTIIWGVVEWSAALLFALTMLYLLSVWVAVTSGIWSGPDSKTVTRLTFIVAPLIFLGGLASAFATVLIQDGRLVVASVRMPLGTGASVLAFIAIYHSWGSIYSLAASVLFGSLVGAMFSFAFLVRYLGLPQFGAASFRKARWRRLGSVSALQLVVGLMSQAPVLVERIIGFGLTPGTVSALNYGRALLSPPLLIAQSVANGSYPRLVSSAFKQERDRTSATMRSASTMIVFLVLPIVVVLVGFHDSIVHLLYYRGAFSVEAAAQTGRIVAILSAGLLPLSLTTLLIRLLYAQQESSRVAVASTIGLLAYLVLALSLGRGYGTLGLAMASPAGSLVLFLALLLALRRHPFDFRDGIVALSRSAGAAVAMTLFLSGFHSLGERVHVLSTERLVGFVAAVASGLFVYCAAALALKSPDMELLLRSTGDSTSRLALVLRPFRRPGSI